MCRWLVRCRAKRQVRFCVLTRFSSVSILSNRQDFAFGYGLWSFESGLNTLHACCLCSTSMQFTRWRLAATCCLPRLRHHHCLLSGVEMALLPKPCLLYHIPRLITSTTPSPRVLLIGPPRSQLRHETWVGNSGAGADGAVTKTTNTPLC